MGPPGNSTLNTDAPKFWIAKKDVVWSKEGTKALQGYKDKLEHLKLEFLYKSEGALFLQSEGDVTRAAAMYLLHPVNQVLVALRPDIRCLSENPGYLIRTDVSYKIGESTRAVVEFKRRGTIQIDQFKGARREVDEKDKRNIDKLIGQANDMKDHTFFTENSTKLMKQATNYAETHAARHVAIFDWNYLVLITFTLEPDRSKQRGKKAMSGEWCHIQIAGESKEMRPALLGFLYGVTR